MTDIKSKDQRKERIMSAVFDQTAVGICLTDERGLFVEVNQAYCNIYGYERAELIGSPFTIVVPDEGKQMAMDLHDRFMEGEPEIPAEWVVQKKDGTLIYIVVTASMMADEDGQKYKITTVTDVSHQKEAQRMVNRFGRILNKSYDEIFLFEAESCRFVQANHSALSNLGFDESELLGLTVSDIHPDLPMEKLLGLLAPLKNGEQEYAVLETRHKRKDGTLYPVEVRFQYIGDESPPVFVSIAQEITEKRELLQIQSELITAAAIQNGLMPTEKPVVSGYCIAGLSIPSKEVSGDYFDFIQGGDGRFTFCLGDVSGKGMPAALLMSNLQAIVRGQTSDAGDVSALLEITNRLIAASMPKSRFISLFYGVLDPETDEILSANAGHLPPIVITKENAVCQLPKGNPALGLRPDIRYDATHTRLKPGDICLIFSDGIIEAMSPDNNEYGEDRLLDLVIAGRDKTSDELTRLIAEDVRTFIGDADQQDDLTVIVIKKETP